ncbi:hypothetical protein HU742_014945 [Pseudomonas sp. SWRI102]|uniref:Uncharacterized protein n=1 Tax=Pseudomonas marvdashtae TaxID=2745500 RepID=A0A923JRH5_9PSED|nr:hypothetical protein [Pseudomonas marvdashtae]MBV4552440.1 hypothetical protein [Pseudomonas marvdashtae]
MLREEKGLGGAIICIMAACAMLFFFPADTVMENPENPNDTQGVPAVAMYLVILIMLTATSVALTGLGSFAQQFLRHRSFTLRIGVYVFANAPLFFTSLLGGVVSLAYSYDTVSGVLAALMFLFSFASLLLAIPQKSN